MNIVILGQGAIGLLWYRALLHLARKQPDINVKISPRADQAASGQSFTFTSFSGLSEQRTLLTSDNKALRECDHLLVCVKSYQVKQALEPVLPHLNKAASIILCHNGMGTLSELSPELIGETCGNDHANHPRLPARQAQAYPPYRGRFQRFGLNLGPTDRKTAIKADKVIRLRPAQRNMDK